MARAILEGVSFFYRWMIDEMEQTGLLKIKAINAITLKVVYEPNLDLNYV